MLAPGPQSKNAPTLCLSRTCNTTTTDPTVRTSQVDAGVNNVLTVYT